MSAFLLRASERWFQLLLRLFPADFRDEMGVGFVETYRDRARDALARGGVLRLAGVWLRAIPDSLRNGPGERAHPAAAWRRGGNWGRDVEIATRRLLRAPALVAAVAGTLTLGLGTFAVVYTVVQRMLIDPMPYEDPDDLYFVWRDYGPMIDMKRGWLGGTDIAELQKASGAIQDASGVGRLLATLSVREGAEPAEVSVLIVSPNFFDMLGVTPALGRGFARHEAGPGRPDLVVLTHHLWTRLGADPAILGTTLQLNGQQQTVIGVMPPDFGFVRHASVGRPQRADAYVTFNVDLASSNPDAGAYGGLIRARRGTRPEAVGAAVDTVGRLVDARDFKSRGLRLYPTGLKADLVAPVRPALIVLGAAGVFLLLVLMVNVASVLLARAAQREHEYAVSRALGANGAAVFRATLVEGGLLGVVGGGGAAVLAIWGTGALLALAPLDLPRREAIGVDWRIAATIVALGAIVGMLASVAPALWAARTTLSSLLAPSAVRGGGGHTRMRAAMVVMQVALSLILLSAGGLVVRSFDRLLRADPGFRSGGVLTMRVPLPQQFYREAPAAVAAQDRVERALEAIPGVTAVSATSSLPLTGLTGQQTIRIPGAPGNTGDVDHDGVLSDIIGTRAGYVELMGMRLVSGRAFDAVRRDGLREVLIDRALAEHFFPNANPIGATFQFRDSTVTIAGVVEQARMYDVHRDGRPQLYIRSEDFGFRTLIFVLRTTREARTLVPDVRAALRSIDGRIALSEIQTMDDVFENALRQQRISAVLIAGFALGALLLSGLGLYGVVAGSVTRRRRELGVRLALGADHRRVLRLVLVDGVRLIGLGLMIGVPGAIVAGQALRGVLVGVSPADPLTLVSVALGLTLVALLACYLPARRVLRIDPAQSLRR
jgi:putative ABC transport system permease protein